MKVIFVNLYDYLDINKVSIPLGILSLATVLKDSHNHSAEVIDFHRLYSQEVLVKYQNLNQNIKASADYILEKHPDCVSLYTMNNTHHIAIMIAKYIKEQNAKIKILLGGPQASLTAVETLKEFSFVDAIGLGEGEDTIELILDAIEKNDYSSVYGIVFRQGSEVINKENKNLILNLDKLPIIDLDLLNCKIDTLISIDIGRGCTYSCSFCSTKNFWKRKYRVKSAERIYTEVTTYMQKYNVKEFSFQHDLFVGNRKLVLQLCDMFIQNKIDISWWCSSRIDTIDEEILYKMSQAGCNGIYFGIECGSQRMQSVINKNLKLSTIDNLIKLLKKYKLKATFSFIYGFPEENYEDINDTLNLIYHIYDCYYIEFHKKDVELQLHKLSFLAKTEVTEKYLNNLEYSRNYHADASLSIESWNDEYLLKIIRNKSIFSQYYEVPSKLRNDLRNIDIAFNTVFVNAIRYLDVTYKLILNAFDNNNLDVYYAFKKVITEEDVYGCYHYNYESLAPLIINVFSIFEKMIYNYEFGEISDLIRNMFNFEKNIFEFSYLNLNRKDFQEIKRYDYDVISMKKSRGINIIKQNIDVIFMKEDENAKVMKIS